MKLTLTIIAGLLALTLFGCDDNNNVNINRPSDITPPPVPQGVYSVTRDHAVLLYWLPIDDVQGDFSTYVVYRSETDPDTGYVEIGTTTSTTYLDQNVINGLTYYYAVSSVDRSGNLSALSYETVFDTPRPQGTNRTVTAMNTLPDFSGWAFAVVANVNYQNPNADFYLDYVDDLAKGRVFYLNAANDMTDLQDMGYTADFDEISFAPDGGWSKIGWCEAIVGHTYVFWTADNNYAKIRVTAINSENIIFDWAYQVATGNPELKPKVPHPADYLRHPGTTPAAMR
jgi:hypothetical protein